MERVTSTHRWACMTRTCFIVSVVFFIHLWLSQNTFSLGSKWKPLNQTAFVKSLTRERQKRKKYGRRNWREMWGVESGRLLADLLWCNMNYLHVDSSEGVHAPLSSPSLVSMTRATVSGNTKNWEGKRKGEGRWKEGNERERWWE